MIAVRAGSAPGKSSPWARRRNSEGKTAAAERARSAAPSSRRRAWRAARSGAGPVGSAAGDRPRDPPPEPPFQAVVLGTRPSRCRSRGVRRLRPARRQAGGAARQIPAVVAEAPRRLLGEVGARAEEGEIVDGEDQRQALVRQARQRRQGQAGGPLHLEGAGAAALDRPGDHPLELGVGERGRVRRGVGGELGGAAQRPLRELEPPGAPPRVEQGDRPPPSLFLLDPGVERRLHAAPARRRRRGAQQEDGEGGRRQPERRLEGVDRREGAPPPRLGEPVARPVACRPPPLRGEHPERRRGPHRAPRRPSRLESTAV